MAEKGKSKWRVVAWVVAILFIISFIMSGIISLFVSDFDIESKNVAMIPIKGVISADGAKSFVSEGTSASETVKMLEKAEKNPSVKAILLEINSPGGSAVASEEIMNKVLSINKTKVAWIREVGASGGYWVASAADHIIASRMSVTGSIGVIGSYLNFGEFLANHSINYERLVAGEYKDIGSPLKELSPAERYRLQEIMDKMHDYFISSVASNRGIERSKIGNVANGMYYLGEDALNLGLVDEIGSYDEAITYIENKTGVQAEVATYEQEKGFIDRLLGMFSEQSFLMGKGIGSSMIDKSKVETGLEVFT